MTRREPPDVAILSARLARAYPTLSPYSAAALACELESIERAQRRHATRQCNGDYLAQGATRRIGGRPLAYDEKQRAGERIERRILRWRVDLGRLLAAARREDVDAMSAYEILAHADAAIELQDDPRGPVLLLRLPNETEPATV